MIGPTKVNLTHDVINNVTVSSNLDYLGNSTIWENITYNIIGNATSAPYNNSTFTDAIIVQDRVEYTISEKAARIFSGSGIPIYILCFIGLVANICSITATCNIPFKQTAHYKLIISLAISDSMVIVALVFYDCMYIFTNNNCIANIAKEVVFYMALIATLLNLFAMAIDHYIANVHPMHYQRLVTNFRCTCLILGIWGLSLVFGLSDLLIATANKLEVCFMRGSDSYNAVQSVICICFLVLVCIVVVYVRIYCIVRHLHNPNQTPQQDEMHNSKALVTTLLIIVSFVISWLPYVIYQLIQHVLFHNYKTYVYEHLETLLEVQDILVVFLPLNTCADPFIYACRLKSVQLGYKEVFYKLFKRKRYAANEVGFRHDRATFISQRRYTTPTILQDNNSFVLNKASTHLIDSTSAQLDCDNDVKATENSDANKANGHYIPLETTDGDCHDDHIETKEDNLNMLCDEDKASDSICNQCEVRNDLELGLETMSNRTESVALSPASEDIDWSLI